VLAAGAHTGATPGHVLYGPGCTASGEPVPVRQELEAGGRGATAAPAR
jgi:hypothetical protein